MKRHCFQSDIGNPHLSEALRDAPDPGWAPCALPGGGSGAARGWAPGQSVVIEIAKTLLYSRLD